VLAEVDTLHGNLSGPATRKLCERAWAVFGVTFEHLDAIAYAISDNEAARRPA
jgi:hypothetical protein